MMKFYGEQQWRYGGTISARGAGGRRPRCKFFALLPQSIRRDRGVAGPTVRLIIIYSEVVGTLGIFSELETQGKPEVIA
jgi:hypothetical protein